MMKETNLKWVDKIPDDWQILPIKAIFNERKENNDPIKTRDILSLTNDRGVIPYAEKGDQGNKSKEDVTEYKLAYPGDIVANSMNLIIGSVGISNYFGCVSPVYYMLYPTDEKKYDRRYFFYQMYTNEFEKSLYGLGNGILEIRMRIPMTKLNMVEMVVPPYKMQVAISNFLDIKVKEIDDLIKKLKNEQETLEEMSEALVVDAVFNGLSNCEKKESNVDYIGKIPSSWEVTMLGNVLKKQSHALKPDQELLVCSNSGTVIKKAETKTGLVSDTENNYQGVKIGELLIHGMDTWHGAIGISNYYGKCTGVVHCCISDQNLRYYYYYLRALAFKKVYKLISNGVRENTSDFRSWSKLAAVLVIKPSLKEQEEIANYLDARCQKIIELIKMKDTEIEKIKEYKKSLIYEYVTGKKEVC